MRKARWELAVAAPAERALARLPEKIAAAIVEFMTGPLLDEPERVGKPLLPPLAPRWSARRGAYRIVYTIDRDSRRIVVVRIGHRSESIAER